jgi:hypothetical protein
MTSSCGRLPFPIGACPTCGQGIKVTRQVRMIERTTLLQGLPTCDSFECLGCPLSTANQVSMGDLVGIQGVGDKFYTPQSFMAEAKAQGISRRIAQVPRGFEVGWSWLFLAHRHAITKAVDPDETEVDKDGNQILFRTLPGVFYVCRPTRIEYISDGTDTEKDNAMLRRGFTLVYVPANDPDHH